MTKDTLTPQEEAFAVAMADPLCKGMTDAYRTAGYSTKGSERTVNTQAFTVANRPHVARRISELRGIVAAAALTGLTGADGKPFDALAVLREWVILATADAGELTKSRTRSCRHCHGIDHAYQWRDELEYARAFALVIDYNAAQPPRGRHKPAPDMIGGFGFDALQPPAADCPECLGDGLVSTWIADTDSLSPAARKLFAGVKQTTGGIEIKTRDQDGALANLAKYFGLTTGQQLTLQNPDGSALNPSTVIVPVDANEAAKLYQKIMAQ
jgi:phage terminase small subunit